VQDASHVNFAMLICVSKHLKPLTRRKMICMCQIFGTRRDKRNS